MMHGNSMMNGGPAMIGSGGMAVMIGMWVTWLLTIAVLVLGIAALLKYLRTNRP
jgi:hypothetical protein